LRARLALLATALLFSTGGAAVKACRLGSWQVIALRSLFAVAALLVAAPSTRGRWTSRVVFVGVTQAATMILFVSATKLTTAANAIFLQSTAPLYVLALAPLVLREPIRRRDVAFLVAFAVALLTIFFGEAAPSTTAPNPALGNWLATASGFAWACTVIGFRLTARDPATFGPALLAGNVIAALVSLPLALPITDARATDWAIVAYLGVFQIGLAYALLSIGMREVPALEASLLMLLEPVLNPVWTWLVHGERPGMATLVGGAIVLGATAVKTIVDRPAYDGARGAVAKPA
jgi:drug/metabolite transporter, DME family